MNPGGLVAVLGELGRWLPWKHDGRPRSSSCGGRAVRRPSGRWSELREALDEVGLGQAEVRMTEIRTDDDADEAGFVGSPTILIDGADLVPGRPDEPIGLSCRVYRRRDGRISPTPDPTTCARRCGGRRAPGGEADDTGDRRAGAGVRAAGHRRHDASRRRRRRRRRRCSCSRATTARTRSRGTTGSRRRRVTTRTAACASWRSTPTTPSATRAIPTRRCSERVAAEDWPMPYLHDASQEVARAYGAQDDAGRVRARLGAAGCAIAARPMPTTTTRARAPRGCATRSTRCSPATSPPGPRRSPWAARSSGSRS